jgi:hypothetical protein
VANLQELSLVNIFGKSQRAQRQSVVDHNSQEMYQHHYASNLRILSIRFSSHMSILPALTPLRQSRPRSIQSLRSTKIPLHSLEILHIWRIHLQYHRRLKLGLMYLKRMELRSEGKIYVKLQARA